MRCVPVALLDIKLLSVQKDTIETQNIWEEEFFFLLVVSEMIYMPLFYFIFCVRKLAILWINKSTQGFLEYFFVWQFTVNSATCLDMIWFLALFVFLGCVQLQSLSI